MAGVLDECRRDRACNHCANGVPTFCASSNLIFYWRAWDPIHSIPIPNLSFFFANEEFHRSREN